MIRLGLMLERSRQDESTLAGPVIGPSAARRVHQVGGGTIWYVGLPFQPRRALYYCSADLMVPAGSMNDAISGPSAR